MLASVPLEPKRHSFLPPTHLIIIFSLIIFGLSACTRNNGKNGDEKKVRLSWTISPSPPRIGPYKLLLDLSDSQGIPLKGTEIHLEGNMTHPGMVPVYAKAKETSPGRYEVPMNFTMGGDWLLFLSAVTDKKEKFKKEIRIPGVSSINLRAEK